MRVAVISDIHGNLEAFREVLADIEKSGAEAVVCLGDIIGYGADPEEAALLVRSLSIPSVMGNHELAIARPEFLSWFNDSARQSLALTEGLLSPETKQWLCRLDASLVFQGGRFVHGCPPDSITDYIFEVSDPALRLLFERMREPVCFVGHTHLLGLISFDGSRVKHLRLRHGLTELDETARHIVNAGSVGQPRDGNNNAKYVLWDTSGHTVEVRFVPYDIQKAVEKILGLGFPRNNAFRLW